MIKKLLAAAFLTAALAGCEHIPEEPLGPPGEVEEILPETFEEKVLNNSYPAVVDFYSEECYGCHLISEKFERLAPEYEGRLYMGKFDVESDDYETASNYIDPASLPVLGCFYEGEMQRELVGDQEVSEIRYFLDGCALLKK